MEYSTKFQHQIIAFLLFAAVLVSSCGQEETLPRQQGKCVAIPLTDTNSSAQDCETTPAPIAAEKEEEDQEDDSKNLAEEKKDDEKKDGNKEKQPIKDFIAISNLVLKHDKVVLCEELSGARDEVMQIKAKRDRGAANDDSVTLVWGEGCDSEGAKAICETDYPSGQATSTEIFYDDTASASDCGGAWQRLGGSY